MSTWPTHSNGKRMKLGEMHRKDRDRIFNRVVFKLGQELKSMGCKVTYGGSLKEDLQNNPEAYT